MSELLICERGVFQTVFPVAISNAMMYCTSRPSTCTTNLSPISVGELAGPAPASWSQFRSRRFHNTLPLAVSRQAVP